MRRLFFLLCIIFLFQPVLIKAQGTFKPLYLKEASFLSLAYSPENNVILATGEMGLISRSTNDGKTWEREFINTNLQNLKSTTFFDKKTVVSCGNMGLCFRSEDIGVTWQRIPLPTQANLVKVAADSTGLALACGENGVLLRSTDFGKEWTLISTDFRVSLNDIKIKGNTVIAVGDTSVILRSNDMGLTWEYIKSPLNEKISHCASVHEGKWFAFTQGYIAYLESNDDGKTWVENLSDSILINNSRQKFAYFTFAEFRDSLFGLASWSSNLSGLFTSYTTDGGKTWRSREYSNFLAGSESLVYLKNGDVMVTLPNSDLINRANNFTFNSKKEISWKNSIILGAKFGSINGLSISPDNKSALFVEDFRDHGFVTKATNDWQNFNYLLRDEADTVNFKDTVSFYDVEVKSSDEYWVYANSKIDGNFILRSTDGGTTFYRWIDKNKLELRYDSFIEFVDKNTGFALTADSAWIYRTTDGGTSWNKHIELDSIYRQKIKKVQRFGDKLLYYSLYLTNTPTAYITYYDFKENKIAKQINAKRDMLYSITPTKIISSLTNTSNARVSMIAISDDGGITWRVPYISTVFYEQEPLVAFKDSLFGVIAAGPEFFIHTTNGGITWQEIHKHYLMKTLSDKNEVVKNLIYTDKGVVFSTTNNIFLWIPPGIGSVNNAQEISGMTIFPNPARNAINMRLTEQLSNNADLGLYDNIGKKVLSKIIPKGTDNFQIDVSNLPNGIYNAVIRNGEKTTTQKVVVAK